MLSVIWDLTMWHFPKKTEMPPRYNEWSMPIIPVFERKQKDHALAAQPEKLSDLVTQCQVGERDLNFL